MEVTSVFDFVPVREEIAVEYAEGSEKQVELHDGSTILLSKLNPQWHPSDREAALNVLQRARRRGGILTGLLYIDEGSEDVHKRLDSSDRQLNKWEQQHICWGAC